MADYVVENLRCTAKSDRIELKWDNPRDVIAAIKYKVSHCPKGSNTPTVYDVGSECSYVIEGLPSATEFEVEVAVSTMLGVISKDVARATISTTEGAPTAPPQNLRGEFDGDSYIHTADSGFNVVALISWDRPPSDSVPGTLAGYRVYYRRSDSNENWSCHEVSKPRPTNCELKGLAGSTAYTIEITCFTSGGESPRSKPITLETAEKNKIFQLKRGGTADLSDRIHAQKKEKKLFVSKSLKTHTGKNDPPSTFLNDAQISSKKASLNGVPQVGRTGSSLVGMMTESKDTGLTSANGNAAVSRSPSARERDRDEERKKAEEWEAKISGRGGDKHSNIASIPESEFLDEDGLPTRGLSARPKGQTSTLAAARAAREEAAETHCVTSTVVDNTSTSLAAAAREAELKREAETAEAAKWDQKVESVGGVPSQPEASLLDVLTGIELNKVGHDDVPAPNESRRLSLLEDPVLRRQVEMEQAEAWERKVGTIKRNKDTKSSVSREVPTDLSAEAAEQRRLEEIKRMEDWDKKVGAGGKVHDLALGSEQEPIPKKEKLKDLAARLGDELSNLDESRARSNSFGTMRGLSVKDTPPSGKKFNTMHRTQSIANSMDTESSKTLTTGPVQSAMVQFMDANDLEDMLVAFDRVCTLASVSRSGHVGLEFFEVFKKNVAPQLDFKRGHLLRVITKKVKNFWSHSNLHSCEKLKVVIVGGGPVGLREAIEMKMLGADVTIIEMRTKFTRFNILHLWDWVCNDLYDLGCSGAEILGKSFFHVGTKELQLLLAKVCLCFGVNIYSGVKFVGTTPSNAAGRRWKIDVSIDKAGHSMNCPNQLEADVLFEAGGAQGPVLRHFNFDRKRVKMSTALGLVAHFEVTPSDRQMEEFSVAAQFKQSVFKKLRDAGLGLENVVYYQGATHYYVMTPQPQALKSFGVIKKVCNLPSDTVKADNIDRDKLHEFARQVATFFDLPKTTPFIKDWNSAQLFDFSSRSVCKVPMKVLGDEKKGQLVVQVLGDSLIEPFWPEGLGVNRGFLSALDSAYNIQEHFHAGGTLSKSAVKKMFASREKMFNIQRVLSAHTKKRTLREDFRSYNLTPYSRYLKWKTGEY